MAAEAVQFEFVYPERAAADPVRDAIQQDGAEAEIKEEPGLLPLAVLLVVAIPPGLALLVKVVNRVVHGWKDHGIVIDARGTGAPRTIGDKSLPHGTVIILTRDGDKSERTELPEERLSDYVSAALGAVAGGATASDANAQASDQTPTSGSEDNPSEPAPDPA